jgi:hypothetical protein
MENTNQPPVFSYKELPALPNSVLSLVLGILSISICGVGLVLRIINLFVSKRELALYAENPGMYSSHSFRNVKTGRACSIIGIILSFVGIALDVFFFIYFSSVALNRADNFVY